MTRGGTSGCPQGIGETGHACQGTCGTRSGHPTSAMTERYVAHCSHGCHTGSGQQGRLVIPAKVRAALGLAPGDRLHLHLAGLRLVLERQQDAVAELRALASDVPKSRSFVEELLAERRRAVVTQWPFWTHLRCSR